MIYRQGDRQQQQRSALFPAPVLLAAGLAVGAAGGITASDLLGLWNGSGGGSCNIKGNVSITDRRRDESLRVFVKDVTFCQGHCSVLCSLPSYLRIHRVRATVLVKLTQTHSRSTLTTR
jgi:hypothetical protein